MINEIDKAQKEQRDFIASCGGIAKMTTAQFATHKAMTAHINSLINDSFVFSYGAADKMIRGAI
jgi:hypothetical protein